MIVESDTYYLAGKHGYMKYANDRYPHFVFQQIAQFIPKELRTAVELGAGMGRFSVPLAEHFESVDLVEPAESYADELTEKFAAYPSVSVHRLTSSEYLRQVPLGQSSAPAIFCFHVLHHLTLEQRIEIYQSIVRMGAVGFFIEPNPINPLILIQVLTHPDMSFAEEKQYLQLGRGAYRRELSKQGLAILHYRRFCLLPPFLADFLFQHKGGSLVSAAEIACRLFPLLCSYQFVMCGANQNVD
jgi:hypothetical protein